MASFSFNRSIKIGDIVYRQVSQNEWLNTKTNQRIPSSALSVLINSSRIKSTTPPVKKVKVESEYFYPRLVKISGIFYKQISPTQWQNAVTGQIFSNINNLLYLNILQTKKPSKPTPIPTPLESPTGGCCEIINGIMQCNEKREEACSGGCFKGAGSNCNVTEENPDACSSCVHCCKVSVGCYARTPAACLAGGGTYFGSNGCTACKFGVCSSDTTVTERFFGNGCTGIFIEGGGVASFDQGVFCTGSGVGQTCFGPGQRYQALTQNFIAGGTCSNCIFGACCTGGSCLGITSQAACSLVSGLFYGGQTCNACDFGVYCTGAGNDRTCIRTGYRGEAISSEFTAGATCSRCIMGTCCFNGEKQVGVRQTDCIGTFFAGIFNQNACDKGSCCLDEKCNENVFRYNCEGVFNSGMTCIVCQQGACCLPNIIGGGCTLGTFATCQSFGGTFFGGQACSACDTGSCCDGITCTDQRRGSHCDGTFYQGQDCDNFPCEIGACCLGATCVGANVRRVECQSLSGLFYIGQTCNACATGANCTEPDSEEEFIDYTCRITNFGNYRETDPTGYFGFGEGCSSCEIGSCCASVQSGFESEIKIRGQCNVGSGSYGFFRGQTLQICATGVFCTGSNEGQTCFGLGYLGQSLTNNFIAGATCSSCILGACCTGGTCLSGGLTSQAACSFVGGLFYAGRTCNMCDFGVYCTGATCLSLGFRGQSLTSNFIVGATCSSCILGACCTGGTCLGGGQTSQAACSSVSGLFYPGATCRSCDFGVYCTGATCFELGYRAQALTNNFIQGATCNSCILGACCTGGTCLGGGQTSQAACSIAGGTFYVGATCFQCDIGVYCTGSGIGQTCFGLGHRGQSLTNNFIVGATCDACDLGVCCTGGGQGFFQGGTCYGATLTSRRTCNIIGGQFYKSNDCSECISGSFCTGSAENTSCVGSDYRGASLSQQFVPSQACLYACVYGAACDGATCLGITSFGSYNDLSGSLSAPAFYGGRTCSACETQTGICCISGVGYELTNQTCALSGGIFFPEGTTALCATGSCCTGGTCTQEILGRSGNCQLFIVGATCGICDTGVFCTGATCLQTGFRGQSLATVFIVGETCSSCIQGICCKEDYEYSQIAGGKEHSVALTTYGEVRGFGGNTYGQSGMTLALGYTGIAAGFYHTLAISNGGTVNAWGRNQYGQSIVPTGLTGVVQVAAGEYHSTALRSDGGVTCWGWNGQGQCDVPSGLTGVTMIAAGGGHNLALKQDGTVVAWGYNFDGQTNVPVGLTGVVQVAAGYHHSLALLTGGGITCWGMTLYGQCNIPAGLTASKIVGGGYHTLILLGNGGVTAIGRNNYNQINVPSGLTAKQIAGGEFHSLAINSSNAVVTWGSNINGESNITSVSCESFNQKQCSLKFGQFNAGATECSVCDVRVNCCLPAGTCSYIFRGECLEQNGIVFEGAENCDLCTLGAFCTGNTCAGFTLKGFSLSDEFVEGNCDNCILGVCCDEDFNGVYTNKNGCIGIFFAGETNTLICSQGITLGMCCTEEFGCLDDVPEQNCTGYFILPTEDLPDCSFDPCKMGVCCDETEITSVTGGVCLGTMRKAECFSTGGEFFALSDGYTCSNCLYTPLLGSVLMDNIPTSTANTFKASIRPREITGWTGNEIQPRLETVASGKPNSWLTWDGTPRFYQSTISHAGAGATTIGVNIASSDYLVITKLNLRNTSENQFHAWYGPPLTQVNPPGTTQETTGLYDYSVAFDLGITRQVGGSLGYITGFTFETPRYARLVFGYGNPSDPYHNKVVVYRYSHADSGRLFSRLDATRHAMLNTTQFNLPITQPTNPFSNNSGTNQYSSPILVEMFAENPLSKRIRPVGACCKGIQCLGIVTQDQCAFTGGTFIQNETCTSCFPGLIRGNCCTGGTHAGFTSEEACNSIGGVFFRGTTFDARACEVGTICNANKTCFEGNAISYYGSFTPTNDKFFVGGTYGETIGCNGVCDYGICCTGGNCLGPMPKSVCQSLGGTTKYDVTCQSSPPPCDLGSTGVCCPFDGGCGVYGFRNECAYGNIFVAGATQGQTCSACESFFRLTQSAEGVTYNIVLNMGTTHGKFFDGSDWVQEKPGLRVLSVRMSYVGMTGDIIHTSHANRIEKDKLVRNTGFTSGSIYVHGCVKNPKPFWDITLDDVVDERKQLQHSFHSLAYSEYDANDNGIGGFVGSLSPDQLASIPRASEIPSSYGEFDLASFLSVREQFETSGITLEAGDNFIINTTNYDPTRTITLFPKRNNGAPYALFQNRAGTIAYGVLNCVSATAAAYINSIGSTFCFRPPTSWPDEDVINKPIYSLFAMEGKIPGQPGNTLIPMDPDIPADKNVMTNYAYPMTDKFAKTYSQVSEFNDGGSYTSTAPIWSMFGARVNNTGYGDRYMYPIEALLRFAYATGPARSFSGIRYTLAVTQEQRKNMIARVVQYGIDCWGATKRFTVLAAAAGQKSGRTRPYIPIAGYFLGETAMYDPEATLLLDTQRREIWERNRFESTEFTCTSKNTGWFGSGSRPQPDAPCITTGDWQKYKIGGTGPENNFRSLRRHLAARADNPALVMVEIINDPTNPVRHYEYVSRQYYALAIEGFGTSGATGITFYNEVGVTRTLSEDIKASGEFGVIRWGSTLAAALPFKGYAYSEQSTKAGLAEAFQSMWLKVISGPGSSGGQGSRYYRIISMNPNGFRDDSRPELASLGGGWQMVIGQTWADGIPDHTSALRVFPYIESDFGITRPCFFEASGFTSGTIPSFNRTPNAEGTCPGDSSVPKCSLWDSCASGGHSYYPTAVPGWSLTYPFMDYITRTKGITLNSDAIPVTDYLKFLYYTSPYNLYTLNQAIYGPFDSVSVAFFGVDWYKIDGVVANINFAKYFPGIRKYQIGNQVRTIW